MSRIDLNTSQNIYFIGIGGIGVSALADLLIELEHHVYGSDIVENDTISKLRKKGAAIRIGHSSDNITSIIDMLVISSAASKDNPEIKRAKSLGIPIIHRSEMLALIVKEQKVVAVAGSHGKTTTTSLVSSVLEEGNLDPTIFIGGIWKNIEGNGKLGNGDYAVIEADESDGSLLNYSPQIALITNIEFEHVDYYESLRDLKNTFLEFTSKLPENGLLILCEDDIHCRELRALTNKRVLTYGLKATADVIAKNLTYTNGQTFFDVYIRNVDESYKHIGRFHTDKMGEHNVSNALASICVGLETGVSSSNMKKGISNCQSLDRRMQVMGEGDISLEGKSFKGITIMQDYGHHPTEIKSTTRALKNVYGNRIITIFQPHRYSRTKMFLAEFGEVLSESDYLLITDIYPGSEKKIEGFSIKNLTLKFDDSGFNEYQYFEDYSDMKQALTNVLKDEDIILFLGAGDIYRLCNNFSREAF
jgi:UDP-N-acetylmuramate--alanine ligase